MFMRINPEVAKEASKQFDPAQVRRSVSIPIRGGQGTVFTFHGLEDGKEHIAIALGDWDKRVSPLVRVHSECLTGDVFSSGKCDCGEQLNEAVDLMHKMGGIILYLRQEGRGIGLYNKIDAYDLQSQGHDTYEANLLLGLKDDLRDYTVAAQMLDALKICSIHLLSNSPDKRSQLEKLGVQIDSIVHTGAFVKESNRFYLATKVAKNGHRIRL